MILPDFLFLGAWNAAKNREVLDHLGINYIVNATAVCESVFEGDEAMNVCLSDGVLLVAVPR